MRNYILLLIFLSSTMIYSQNKEIDFHKEQTPKFDFVVFSVIQSPPLYKTKYKLFTGKINHKELKDFFSHYFSVSSTGYCKHALVHFYYKNKKIGSKYIEIFGRNTFETFMSDIKKVSERTKKFKTLKKYKDFKNKKSKRDNAYIININDENEQYVLKWYEW